MLFSSIRGLQPDVIDPSPACQSKKTANSDGGFLKKAPSASAYARRALGGVTSALSRRFAVSVRHDSQGSRTQHPACIKGSANA